MEEDNKLLNELYDLFKKSIGGKNKREFFIWALRINDPNLVSTYIYDYMNWIRNLYRNEDFEIERFWAKNLSRSEYLDSEATDRINDLYSTYIPQRKKLRDLTPSEMLQMLINFTFLKGLFISNIRPSKQTDYVLRKLLTAKLQDGLKKHDRIWVHGIIGSGCTSFIKTSLADILPNDDSIDCAYYTEYRGTLSKTIEDIGKNHLAPGAIIDDYREPVFNASVLVIDNVPQTITEKELSYIRDFEIKIILISTAPLQIESIFYDIEIPSAFDDDEVRALYKNFFGEEASDNTICSLKRVTNGTPVIIKLLFEYTKQFKTNNSGQSTSSILVQVCDSLYSQMNYAEQYKLSTKGNRIKVFFNGQAQTIPGHLYSIIGPYIDLISGDEREVLKLLCCFGAGSICRRFVEYITINKISDTSLRLMAPLGITYSPTTIYIPPMVVIAVLNKATVSYDDVKSYIPQICRYLSQSINDLDLPYLYDKIIAFTETINRTVKIINNRGERPQYSASVSYEDWMSFLHDAFVYYDLLGENEYATRISKILNYPQDLTYKTNFSDKHLFMFITNLQSETNWGDQLDQLTETIIRDRDRIIASNNKSKKIKQKRSYIDYIMERHLHLLIINYLNIIRRNSGSDADNACTSYITLLDKYVKQTTNSVSDSKAYYIFAAKLLYGSNNPLDLFNGLNTFQSHSLSYKIKACALLISKVSVICIHNGNSDSLQLNISLHEILSGYVIKLKDAISNSEIIPPDLLELTCYAYTYYRIFHDKLYKNKDCCIQNSDVITLIKKNPKFENIVDMDKN